MGGGIDGGMCEGCDGGSRWSLRRLRNCGDLAWLDGGRRDDVEKSIGHV